MRRSGLAGAASALLLAAGVAVAESPCAQLPERELAGTEAAVVAFLRQDHAGFLDQIEGLRERDPDRYSAMLAEMAGYRSAPFDSCEIMAVQRISERMGSQLVAFHAAGDLTVFLFLRVIVAQGEPQLVHFNLTTQLAEVFAFLD